MSTQSVDFDAKANEILSQYDTDDMYTLVARLVYQLNYTLPTLDTKWVDYCFAHFGMADDICKMNRALTFGDIFERSKKCEDIMKIIAPDDPDVSPLWGTACLATMHQIINKKRNIVTRMLDKVGIHFMK